MLPELAEDVARGDIARIYAEVRELCGVPYVSSLHRHLATRPGWLEWCWAAVRPAYISGRAQTAAWAAAAAVPVAPLPPLAPSALRVLGVDRGDSERIRAVCDSFIRVSPTNLMFVALVRAQLAREPCTPGPGTVTAAWAPPAPPPPLPPMVDLDSVGDDLRATLMQLSNTVSGRPFVPGLYRMLANWPAYTAHVATLLAARMRDPDTVQACHALAAHVDQAATEVLVLLGPPGYAPPAPAEQEDVLAAMQRYRKTSPEMVIFGRLIAQALPAGDAQVARPVTDHVPGDDAPA